MYVVKVGVHVVPLHPFVGSPQKNIPQGIQMKLTDYLELVDWTGRTLRRDKRGAIPKNTKNILARLGIDDSQWLEITECFEDCFRTFAGGEQSLGAACETLNYKRPPGLSRCKTSIG